MQFSYKKLRIQVQEGNFGHHSIWSDRDGRSFDRNSIPNMAGEKLLTLASSKPLFADPAGEYFTNFLLYGI